MADRDAPSSQPDVEEILSANANSIRFKQFDSTLRGYGKEQVREFLGEIAGSFEQLRTLVLQLRGELNAVRNELAQVTAERDALKIATPPGDPYEQVGERMAEILRAVDREATELRERTENELEAMRAQARREADEVRERSEEEASRARLDAEEDIARMREERDRLLNSLEQLWEQVRVFEGDVGLAVRSLRQSEPSVAGSAASATEAMGRRETAMEGSEEDAGVGDEFDLDENLIVLPDLAVLDEDRDLGRWGDRT